MKRIMVCLLLVLSMGAGPHPDSNRTDTDKGRATVDQRDDYSVVAFTSVSVAKRPNILFCISDDQSYATREPMAIRWSRHPPSIG